MNDLTRTMALSASGMRAQSDRLRHVSENIANADTPGYRRKLVAFESVMQGGRASGEVRPGPVRLDKSPLPEIHDPAHPLADETGKYLGSNVDLVV